MNSRCQKESRKQYTRNEERTTTSPRLQNGKEPHLLHEYEVPDSDVGAGDGALPSVSRHLLVLLLVDLFVPLPPTYVIYGLADHCYHDDEPLANDYKVCLDCYFPWNSTNLNYFIILKSYKVCLECYLSSSYTNLSYY